MKYRALDEKGDYTLGKRKFLTGVEAVQQAILTRMKLLRSEWWEDTEDGLPLFERILGSYGGDEVRQAVDLIISERILGTEDVAEIKHFESTFSNREYKATCTINTIYGETVLAIGDNFRKVEVMF